MLGKQVGLGYNPVLVKMEKAKTGFLFLFCMREIYTLSHHI